MNDLWVDHFSVEAWNEPKFWADYFDQVQQLFGSPLTHLDVNDPVRRKLGPPEVVGDFVCSFGPREDSRWLFGKFKDAGIDFTIRHFRQLGRWPNSLTWHFPLSFAERLENRQRLKALFDLGNRTLKPFYAYC